MDVVALDEGFDHVGVFAEVGHDAQLDLRVVGREEFAAVVGDEGLADLLAVLVADGDVLQVGVARAESAGGGDGLVERRVDASRPRVDELGQGFGVGAQQLLQAAVLQYLAYDVVLAAEAFEHFFGGDVLAGLGLLGFLHQLEAVEEHFAHLLGRGDVEGSACQGVDVFLDLPDAGVEVRGRLLQGFRVEAHAVALDVHEDGHERHLYFIEEMFHALRLEFLLEDVLQLEGDVGVFAGVAVDFGGGEVAHALLSLAPRADELVDVDGAVVQVDFGQVVHVVPQLGLEHVVGEHGVEERTLHADAVVLQDNHVVLDVLPHLHRFRVFVERAELVHNF